MSATLEGIFVLIDRASGPMKNIERQAKKTDAMLKGTGESLDKVGTNKQLQQMEKVERQFRNVDRAAGGFSGGGGNKARRTIRGMGDDSDRLSNKLARVGAALQGVSKLFGISKLPAMAVAIGSAVQAVSALTAGLVALGPRIVDLSGGAAAAIPFMVGLGGAAITAKLAFNNLGKALSGNKKALQSLTPEGRQFLQTLKSYQPVIAKLRSSAQQGLFPGLDQALQKLRKAQPLANSLVKGFGQRLGSGASRAATMITGKGFQSDLGQIGAQGQRFLTRSIDGVLNLVDALRHLAVAAIPFNDWLSKTILGWTKWADASAKAGQQSGSLARFFDRTKASMTTFGHILGNLWTTLRNLGKAARPLGDDLWGSLDKATKRWADWTGSMKGQNWLVKWFNDARAPLHELFGLVGDLAKAIVSINMSGLTKTIQTLRQAVAPLQRGLGDLAASVGPSLAAALVQIVRTLANLTGPVGTITLFLRGTTNVLKIVNDLLEKFPALGRVISSALTVAAIYRLTSGLRTLAGGWFGVERAANSAAVAEERAATVGMGGIGGGARVAGAGLGVRGSLGAVGDRYAFSRSLGAGRAASAGTAVRGLPALLGAGTEGGLGGAAAAGLSGAARFLWPLAAFGGVLGATQGTGGRGPLGLGQNILAGATFGAINPVVSPGDAAGKRVQQYVGRISQDPKQGLGAINREIQRVRDGMHGGGLAVNGVQGPGVHLRSSNITQSKEEITLLQREADSRKAVIAQLKEEHRVAANQRSRTNAARTVNQLQRSFGTQVKGGATPEAALHETANSMIGALKTARPAGRRQIAENMLDWAREQARQNPKLIKQYHFLRDRVVDAFAQAGVQIKVIGDRILTGTQSQWKSISDAITSRAQLAQEQASASFTLLQRQAIGALETMGFDASTARGLVSGMESKSAGQRKTSNQLATAGPQSFANRQHSISNKSNARGGRIGGVGLADTVPVGGLAAPGELISNRHTERRVNSILGQHGTSLGREVQREGLPHNTPMYNTGARVRANATPAAGPTRSVGLAGVQAGVRNAAQMILGKFPGLSVTSTTGGGHAKNSLHYLGEAVDIGGDVQTMHAAADWINSNLAGGLAEGIHNPNLSVKNGREVSPATWGATTWAQHLNHIHVGVIGGALRAMGFAGAGAASLGGQSMRALRGIKSGLGGAPGALADRASAVEAAGLTQMINSRLGSMGGLDGFTGGGAPSANQRLGRRMMIAAGWPASQWPALKSLWTQESGWNSNAVNKASGAYGIPQSLGHGHPYNLGDAPAQIKWGLDYIKGRYGSPAGAWAHEQSNNWYGSGLDAIVSSPTMIGVGDRYGGRGSQKERVRVTPVRQGSGTASRRGGVHIAHMEIHISGADKDWAAKIRRQAKSEVEKAFDDFDRELARAGVEDDGDLT